MKPGVQKTLRNFKGVGSTPLRKLSRAIQETLPGRLPASVPGIESNGKLDKTPNIVAQLHKQAGKFN